MEKIDENIHVDTGARDERNMETSLLPPEEAWRVKKVCPDFVRSYSLLLNFLRIWLSNVMVFIGEWVSSGEVRKDEWMDLANGEKSTNPFFTANLAPKKWSCTSRYRFEVDEKRIVQPNVLSTHFSGFTEEILGFWLWVSTKLPKIFFIAQSLSKAYTNSKG